MALNDRYANGQRASPRAADGKWITKLTAAKVAEVAAAIEAGAGQRDASVLAGVSWSSLKHWLVNGANEGGSKLERQLHQAVALAYANRKSKLVGIVEDAAVKDARHAEWLLERTFRDEFGPVARVDARVDAKVDHRHSLDLGNLEDGELAKAIELLAKAGAAEIVEGEVIELPVRELDAGDGEPDF